MKLSVKKLEAVTPSNGHAHLEHRPFLVASGAIYLRVMRGKIVNLHDNQKGRQLQRKKTSQSSEQDDVGIVTGIPLRLSSVRIVLLVRDPRGTMQSRRHRVW
ncbi:hypothetical protein M5D96_009158, partial [Drosophila gunungcola]